nr:MAG TPA: hypothetical protein [Caudoviricetes sp.]
MSFPQIVVYIIISYSYFFKYHKKPAFKLGKFFLLFFIPFGNKSFQKWKFCILTALNVLISL